MVEILERPFDPYVELRRYQDRLAQQGKFGATASFVGTMRDVNEDASVESMTLEHYPGMTEKHLIQISEEARRQWDILETLIVHRVGALSPNDPIVLIVVWSIHRAPAFEACRYLIEALKARAPFWKREQKGESLRWVERNTPAK